MDGEGGLDPGQPVEPAPIPGRDRDRPLVDDAQVALGRPEHVEVVAEPRPGVELPERLGDPRRDARSAEAPRSTSFVPRPRQGRTHPSQEAHGGPAARPRPSPRLACCAARSLDRLRAGRSRRPGCGRSAASPSTVTFQLAFVRPAAIGSAVTARPAHGGIAAMTCSIVGVTVSMAALLPQRIGRSEARERSPGNLQGSELARLHHRPEPGEIAPERARECPCQEPVERTQPPAHREVPVPVDPRAAIDRCERP